MQIEDREVFVCRCAEIGVTWIFIAGLAAAFSIFHGEAKEPDLKRQAEWRDETCLVRAAEGVAGRALAIRRTPGDDATILNVIDPAWRSSPFRNHQKVQLEVEPGGAVETRASFVPHPFTEDPTPALLLISDDANALKKLAKAKSLKVTEAGQLIAEFSLPPMEDVVASIGRCEDQQLSAWGIDPKMWNSLRSRPVPRKPINSLVSGGDYPREALSAGASGRTVVRLRIDEKGKPTSCASLVGSGVSALDRQTCAILVKRARFNPAVDASGRTVSAYYVAKIRWNRGF